MPEHTHCLASHPRKLSVLNSDLFYIRTKYSTTACQKMLKSILMEEMNKINITKKNNNSRSYLKSLYRFSLTVNAYQVSQFKFRKT